MHLPLRRPSFFTGMLLWMSLLTAAIPVVADPTKSNSADTTESAAKADATTSSLAPPAKTIDAEIVEIPEEALEPVQGPDTPLVVVPEVDHQRQRFFLSSFKLPKKL